MSKIYVIGIGPGNEGDMTRRAWEALSKADIIIGYKTYIDLIQGFFPDKNFVRSGMKQEVERCRQVLDEARKGADVALISSGDSGIYGMAGIMLEVLYTSEENFEIEIIPGITSMSSSASILGAPLMHDFAAISLSDLMTPMELIEKRLKCAAEGDFIICLYNPKSSGRILHIEKARKIIMEHRSPETPVGIVRNAGRETEEKKVTTLLNMLDHDIDMFTTVIIGNSKTYIKNGRIITPRGYTI